MGSLRTSALMALVGIAIACAKDEAQGTLGYQRPLPTSVDELEAYYRSLLQERTCLRHVPAGTFVCEFFSFVPCEGPSPFATAAGTPPLACVSEHERRDGPVSGWCLVGPHVEGPPFEPLESREDLQNWCGGHFWAEGPFASSSCSAAPIQSVDASVPTATVATRGEACLLFPAEETLAACRRAFCP